MGNIEKMHIKCDEDGCFFKTEEMRPERWRGIPCPVCKKGVIINNIDWIVIKMIRFILWVDDVAVKINPSLAKKSKHVHLDTAPLRNGEDIKVEKVDNEEGE